MIASIIILLLLIIIPAGLIVFFMKVAIGAGFSIYKDFTGCPVARVKQVKKNLFEGQIEEILRRKNAIY